MDGYGFMDGYDTHFQHFPTNQTCTESTVDEIWASGLLIVLIICLGHTRSAHSIMASWHRRPPVCFDRHEDGKPSVGILCLPSRKGAGAIPKYMYGMN